MDKSVEFLMDSQPKPLSQDLVLVESGSPKRSTKITARSENLLAIHRKILLHLRNEKPMMKFELCKLLSIIKRIDCSSPRDQKVAQSAHDILVKCIYSQSSKDDNTLPRNISNTTLSSSTTNESQTSDDSYAKCHQHRFDVESKTPLKTASFTYQLAENGSMLHQTKSDQHFLNQTSASTINDSETKKPLYDVRSETPYECNNLFDRFTENATFSQIEVEQVNKIPVSHSNSENKYRLFDVGSETLFEPDNYLQYRSDKSASTSHKTESELLQLNVTSGSNIFSSHFGDEEMSFVKEMTVPNDKGESLLATNVYNRIDNDGYNNENSSNVPLTVPTLIEKKDYSSFPQSSNVLKLRLADVQFDSDTVSIPMELLTNLNFGSDEKHSQEVIGRGTQSEQQKISRNKAPMQHVEQNEPNTSTLISNFTGYSLDHSNNLESMSSKRNVSNSTFTSDKQRGKKMSWTITSDSTTGQQRISSFSTNRKMSILNIEMEATNSKKSPTSKGASRVHLEVPAVTSCTYVPRKNTLTGTVTNVKGENFDNTRYVTPVNYLHPKNVALNNGNAKNVSNDSFAPGQNILVEYTDHLNDVEADITTRGNFDNASYISDYAFDTNDNKNVMVMPLNHDTKNANVSSESPDLGHRHLGLMTDDMEICKDWKDEEKDIEMTEAEKRYLEMAASETNDFILDENKISNLGRQGPVAETDNDSFVFNLDTSYSSDIIEATPYDNPGKKRPRKKIKTLRPKKPKSQTAKRNPLIISETEDIIVDETPCDTNSETPSVLIDGTSCGITQPSGSYGYNNSGLQSAEVHSRVQTPMCQQHTLFNPYKIWPCSNSFQDMYKSDYQRNLLKPVSENSRINILGNITLNEGNATQSQSFGMFTPPNKTTENMIEKVAILDIGDSLSLRQFTNITSASPPPLPNNNYEEYKPSTSKNKEPVVSENMVFIDGTQPKNVEQMDTTKIELEEKETFEDKTRKLKEKIIKKRMKYRNIWNEKPLKEKVSLKYVKKFSVNIFEDPVNSLLNIGYNANVNNFQFPRLTLEEMKEKLHKSSEKAIVLNEALTKMVDLQISNANEDYKSNTVKDVAGNLDSDDSSNEEETERKKKLEIQFLSQLELKKFKEELEKERKKFHEKL